MKLNLIELGLKKDASFDEIQSVLTKLEVFDANEVKNSNNKAASGARKAAEDEAAKNNNLLTDEQMKEFVGFKKDKKIKGLLENEDLSKFNESDRKLIIMAYRLDEIEDSGELDKAIKDSLITYKEKLIAKEIEKLPPKNDGIFDGPEEKDESVDIDSELQGAFD